jgi:hypothetical protein
MTSPSEMQLAWEELNRRVKDLDAKYGDEISQLKLINQDWGDLTALGVESNETKIANFLITKPELLEEPDEDRYLVACYMARQLVLMRKHPEGGGPAMEGGLGAGGFDDSEFEGADLPMPEARSIEFVKDDE